MIKNLLTGLVNLVYPPHCLICKRYLVTHSPTEKLCSHCQNMIIPNIPPFCPKCSRHLSNVKQARCRECIKRNPQFDFAWAACLYHPPLRDLICTFKYNQKTLLRKPLSQLMASFINTYHLDIRQFEIITPIPLFSSRLRERGYNQSHLLSQEIALKYHIDLSTKNLIRIRNTEHQTLLCEKERWTNIDGAFRIRNPAEFQGKNILIIDDLLTTGATASEAAHTLKSAGAETVGILTLAITA